MQDLTQTKADGAQHRTQQTQLLQLIKGRNRTIGSYKKSSKKWKNSVEFIEDWVVKLAGDGYPIERVLQILMNNSVEELDRAWVFKFLNFYKRTLQRRIFHPRVCLPHMFIQLDEDEVKQMVKKEYQLQGKASELELVMKGYKWRGLKWIEIVEQLSRNRYEAQKISMTMNQARKQETVGVLFGNKQMRKMQMKYGDSIYMLQYSQSLEGPSGIKHAPIRHLIVGLVVSQFRLPIVVFYALYDSTPSSTMDYSNAQKESLPGYFGKLNSQEAVPLFVANYICEWISHKPYHITLFRIPDQVSCSQVHAVDRQTYRLRMGSKTVITSVLVQSRAADGQVESTWDIQAYLGPFTESSNSLVEIYHLLNNGLTANNQYSIGELLNGMQDPCLLITMLIKISVALDQESVTKREPSIEVLLDYSQFSQCNNVYTQIRELKGVMCSRSMLEILINTLQKAIHYTITELEGYWYRVGSADGQYSDVRYNMKYGHWECSCNYGYQTGLPCGHIVKLLLRFDGHLSYYVSSRWKHHPTPTSKVAYSLKNPNGCAPITNKGLARLIKLYQQS